MQEKSEVLGHKPLTGMIVLDLSIMMAGPYCGRMLSDLGARVIKIEAPGGDIMRNSLPTRGDHSAYFAHLNAGKESVVLDLKKPAAVKAVLQIAAKADVLLENFRPSVLKRLGLGYDVVSEVNSKIVYCSISGYGQHGSASSLPAFAPIVHAASGIDLINQAHQGADAPLATGIFTADVLAAMYGVIAVQAALGARHLTGHGQHVDVTLYESMLSLLPYEVQEAQFPLESPRAIYRPIRASDGWLMLMVLTQANFENLCDAINRPDLKADVRFRDGRGRSTNRAALMSEVEAWTSSRTAADCESVMGKMSVPCARYRTITDSFSHPTVVERNSYENVQDAYGSLKVPNLPFLMGGQRPNVENGVALLGEQTDAVLREFTQLTKTEMDEL